MKLSLSKQNAAAWLLVIASILGLGIKQPLAVAGLLILTLLVGLVWALMTTVKLRKSPQQKTAREAVFWRVAFLAALGALTAYLGWRSWYFLLAMLSFASAALLWRSSRAAQYPLYATTLLVIVDFANYTYAFVRHPEIWHYSVGQQAGSLIISIIISAILINCCLYARRIAQNRQNPQPDEPDSARTTAGHGNSM